MATLTSGASSIITDEDGPNTKPASSVSSRDLSIDTADIAVISYSCRVPGGNSSPSQLWDFLLKKDYASGKI